MASSETDASANRGRKFFILNQKLDNPMDKEAEKLQSGYSQKVWAYLTLYLAQMHLKSFKIGEWAKLQMI